MHLELCNKIKQGIYSLKKYKNCLKIQHHVNFKVWPAYKIQSVKQEYRSNKLGLCYVSTEVFSFSKSLTSFSVTGTTAELLNTGACPLASVQSLAPELVTSVGVMAFVLLRLRSLWGQKPPLLVKQTREHKMF